MSDFAILAPVPELHLRTGQQVARERTHVSFASKKWELFQEIDRLREGSEVPVLIYASHDELAEPSFRVSWCGWYVGCLTDRDDMIREERLGHRPPSTIGNRHDDHRAWAVYWRVRALKPVSAEQVGSIGSFRSYKSGHWRQGSAPRGPELVDRPSWL